MCFCRLYIVHMPPRLSCTRPSLNSLYLSVIPSCQAIVHQPLLLITLHGILSCLNWQIAAMHELTGVLD